MAKKEPLAPDRQGKIFFVDSRRLRFQEGFNRRKDYGDLEQFLLQIKAAGLDNLDPLTCYKEGEDWMVIKGHRRTLAIRIWETQTRDILFVPMIRARNGYNVEKSILEQIAQNQKDFTPLEKATVVSDMRGMGWSEGQMVKGSGLSAVYIRKLLLLADAPKKLIKLIEEGRLTGTYAMEVIADGKVEEVITKAEQGQPVETPHSPTLFVVSPPTPAAGKITKSDIRPNPWKIFKKWASTVEEEKLPPVKLEAWNLLIKIRDGEATEEDFKNFFS